VSTVLAGPSSALSSPPARRLPARRRRDWRLLLGVLLVLGSTVVGARLVVAADDTVATWAADTTLVPGTPLRAADLRPVPVRIEGTKNPYLTGVVPDGYVVVRTVGPGELVPAIAVAPAERSSDTSRLVAVAVDPAGLPGRLEPGDRVDAWAVADETTGTGTAQLLAAEVPVVEVPAADGGFAGGTSRTVVLAVDAGPGTSDLVGALVAASSAGRVVLTAAPSAG
jgi:hypothetical protein